jgi:hypothetical protein
MPWSGNAAIGFQAADVDQRPAFGPQVPRRHQRPVDHAPEIRLEQLAHVCFRQLLQLAEDKHAGIVDPRVDAAVAGEREGGDLLMILVRADIGFDEAGRSGPAAWLI